jgi:hypothetical protein
MTETLMLNMFKRQPEKPPKPPGPETLPPLPPSVIAAVEEHADELALKKQSGKKSSRDAIVPSSHQRPTDAGVSSKRAVPSELPDAPAMPKQIRWKNDKAA